MGTGELGALGMDAQFLVEEEPKQAPDNVIIHLLCMVVSNVQGIMKDLKLAMRSVVQVIFLFMLILNTKIKK